VLKKIEKGLWKEISKRAEDGKEKGQNGKKTRDNCRNMKEKKGEEKVS
jgi:hypothetical protein